MARVNSLVIGLVATLCLVMSASAQPAAGAGQGSGGVGFSAKHAEDQLTAIRDILGVTDDGEWGALAPKIAKVITAKQGMSSGAGMKWTSSNNAKPTFAASDATPATAPGKAMQELREAVAEPEASKDALAGRVAAMRKARQKARADYEAAQQALLGALTPRQEAILMTLGVLD